MAQTPVVLGIDFGGTKIATAVCDLAGNKLGSAVVDSLADYGARASFDHGVRAARDLLGTKAAGVPLAAVGVATFGIPFDDRVELAPAIDGWAKLELGRELRRAFPGVAIRMATDAKAAAQAEVRWGSLAGFDPAIYLNLGTGLAAAIVAGGQVLAGSQGAAGEIGYSLREPADVGRADGLRIPLEDMVSGQALQRRASLHGASLQGASLQGASLQGAGLSGAAEAARTDGQRLTAAEIFARATADAEFNDLITDFVDELAFHLVNLAIAVNPARIAVGGGMTRSWDRIGPRLEEALLAGVPYPPDLVLAHFPHDAPLLGAVALAVDAATGAPGRQPAPALDIPSPDGYLRSGTSPDSASSTTSIANLS